MTKPAGGNPPQGQPPRQPLPHKVQGGYSPGGGGPKPVPPTTSTGVEKPTAPVRK
jgi:hypothetical protein